MRTILYSTERVTANNWETGLFIVFLLIFAIAASAYVLINGLKVGFMFTYLINLHGCKMTLRCVMDWVVTSLGRPLEH